jgi:hypothetical protein
MAEPRTKTEADQPKDQASPKAQNAGAETDVDELVEPRGNTGVRVAKTGDATDPSAAGGLATKETTRPNR